MKSRLDPAIRLILLAALLHLAAAPGTVAQTNFATIARDGAWTWYNDPRALFHNGKLYFGFVRAADGKSALGVFDLGTGIGTNLWASDFTQLDDHNNPGLLSKRDGGLLAIYARHISDQFFAYRLSTSPEPATPADWTSEQRIPSSGAGMTYANPFQLSAEAGTIYNYCRNLNFNPTVYVSTNGGSNWTSPRLFIQAGTGGSVRPYVKYSSDYENRIDFLYTDGHPRDVANSLYHLYYRDGAYHKTDGTVVKSFSNLPILHDSGERGSVIYQYSAAAQSDPNQWIPTARAWCWETATHTNNQPVCVFTVQRDNVMGGNWFDDRIYYYYARWTGTNWQKRFIAHAGRPLYSAEDDYAGGICVDPKDPNVIYISSNAADPFNLANTANVPLRAAERYELWRGVTSDGGLTFDWTQVTHNSTVDNLRPYIPRRNGGEPCVIWFQGNYSTYTSYSTSLVGLFSTRVPTPAPAPLITYVDATTGMSGNTTLASGGVLNPPATSSGTDGVWRLRTLGNSATTFESGGDTSAAGNAANGNSEDTPTLKTTISGLTPGVVYNIYAYFWSAAGSQDWRLRAGLTNLGGSLPLFANSTHPTPVASEFSNPPLITEADRTLQQAPLGFAVADAEGKIEVYVDDDPAARAGMANGWNLRTWYDGVGYSRATSSTAAKVNASADGASLWISWPETHIGWVLQSQTNALDFGLTTDWHDVSGTSLVTQAVVGIDPLAEAVFYRLRHP
ncbi:MAG TPA: BNR-4 repeat-containing protein [Verrucomicrobiae bacterium]|nr:BNR-4 repeat-containing protein [Verrucomicrobiae bacterium]